VRLHRLEVSAFGPFAATVGIDLDAVAEGGLFLIRGATGAGKTSLLDAVCFALYADVPGARTKKGLHSDHAEPGVVPSVLLELTAGGRRLRLERSPEFTRPKSRGTGTVTVPAKGSLSELHAGSWQVLSTRQDEIGEVVRDVLGMGMEQFSKVVLLPQGDFAAFLRATPEERRGLLERLFDVSSYAELEEWFAARRRESSAELEAQRAGLSADLGVLTEVLAGLPPDVAGEPLDWSAAPVEELPSALEAAQRSLGSAVAVALAERDAAALTDTAATEAHRVASEAVVARTRGLQARARLAALDDQHADHEAAVLLLERATRAATVRGDLGALDRARVAVESAREALDATAADVSALPVEDVSTQALTGVLELLAAGGRRLDEVALRAAAVTERTRRRDEVQRRAAAAKAAVEKSKRELGEASAAHEAAVATLQAVVEQAAHRESAEREVARLVELRGLRLEQDRESAREHRLRTEVAAAREHAQELRDHYLDLRQARLDGMAAELAGRLEAGEPCAVCGGTDHPAPAPVSAAVPAEDVEAAESSWRTADQSVGALAQELAGVVAASTQRGERLAGDERDLATLDTALAESRERLASLTAAAARCAALRTAVDGSAQALQRLATDVEEAQAELAATASALQTIGEDLAAEQAGLDEAMADHAASCPCRSDGDGDGDPTFTAARRRHDRATKVVHSHVAASEQHQHCQADLDQTTHVLAAALAELGFDDEAAARSALLPPPEVAELRRVTAAHEQARQSARATLEEPDVAAALGAEEPDLALLAGARDAARAILLAASSHEALLRRGLAGLDRVHAAVVHRCAGIADAATQHALVRDLADTLGGGGSNELRMRLSSFVLAARLERVAALANERLTTMGDGRYQLRHTDAPAARGARSGLGLEVLDLWTGQARDTATLSGGESFMASLALALGLADAVREESGGFDLQTLFVDEGFGTLDDDTLEQVMGVLDGLREGGRAVGVVSHVAELRTRIPSQVVVRKTERGSSVQVTLVNEPSSAA
jgi:DNA repair protein SbcC/Rad50